MVAPRSLFESLARFEPYNEHFVQDIGAFQLGLAAVLLLPAIAAGLSGVTTALLGAGLGRRSTWLPTSSGRELGAVPACCAGGASGWACAIGVADEGACCESAGSAGSAIATVRQMTWVVVALIPPIGHAAWSLARSTGEVGSASPVAIALAAVLLEVALFVGLVLAVVAAARLTGAPQSLLTVVRPLAWAQLPAALYFLGLIPAITYFMPLLPLVLAARVATSVRAASRIAGLSSPVAVVAVLVGSAAGVLFGFAAASVIYS